MRRINITPFTASTPYPSGFSGRFDGGGTFRIAINDAQSASFGGSGASSGIWVQKSPKKSWSQTLQLSNSTEKTDGNGHSYYDFSGGNPSLSGRIYKGLRPGGDYVPASTVGAGYRSPGYN